MKKILIVEDDETILELLKTVFSFHEEYETILVRDGAEALVLVKTLYPAVVILDKQIPTLDGIEVCRRIKASAANGKTRIIMLTGMAQETDRAQAEEAGADRFITKPFRTSTIVDMVAELTA